MRSSCPQNKYSGYRLSAVTLDKNRVFIAHCYGSNYNLYGVVCTINGTTITKGTDTQLSSTQWSGIFVSACLLPDGNVFIAHSYGTSYNLYGIVVSINGTTITKGTDKVLSSTAQTGKMISTCLLSDGNVFIAHSFSTDYKLYGIIVKISNTTVTTGTDTVLNSNTYTGMGISANTLPSGNVFIAHSYDSNYYLYGMTCTTNGTTITVAKNIVLNNSTTYTGAIVSTCVLPSGNILLVHGYSTSYKLYGMVCNINGTTITKGTDTALSSVENTGQRISICLLPSNDVLITHNYSGSYMLYGMVATVNGTTITKGTDTELNNAIRASEWISSLPLANGGIFVAHSCTDNYHLHAQIFGISNNIPTNNVAVSQYETQVRKATTSDISGVAKTNGTGGDSTGHNELVSVHLPKCYYQHFNLVTNSVDNWNISNNTGISNVDIAGVTNALKIEATVTSTTGSMKLIKSKSNANTSDGHKYYVRMGILQASTNTGSTDISFDGYAENTWTNYKDDTWHVFSSLRTRTSGSYSVLDIASYLPVAGDTHYINIIYCLDLTAIFGAGNEPNKTWCDANL